MAGLAIDLNAFAEEALEIVQHNDVILDGKTAVNHEFQADFLGLFAALFEDSFAHLYI